jgi:hypothetical protein
VQLVCATFKLRRKIMNASTRNLFALGLAACLVSALSTSAMAESNWGKDHPRRHEVNHRLKTQNARIHHQVKEGELSKQQAASLHKDDRQIRQEERDMASQNGGHITKQEQHTLNRQENAVSKEIGQ